MGNSSSRPHHGVGPFWRSRASEGAGGAPLPTPKGWRSGGGGAVGDGSLRTRTGGLEARFPGVREAGGADRPSARHRRPALHVFTRRAAAGAGWRRAPRFGPLAATETAGRWRPGRSLSVRTGPRPALGRRSAARPAGRRPPATAHLSQLRIRSALAGGTAVVIDGSPLLLQGGNGGRIWLSPHADHGPRRTALGGVDVAIAIDRSKRETEGGAGDGVGGGCAARPVTAPVYGFDPGSPASSGARGGGTGFRPLRRRRSLRRRFSPASKEAPRLMSGRIQLARPGMRSL